jgi:hypothetical protein
MEILFLMHTVTDKAQGLRPQMKRAEMLSRLQPGKRT